MSTLRGQLRDSNGNDMYPKSDGYFPGETVTLTCWGFGYTTSTSGTIFLMYPISKPIYADTAEITAINGFVVRGINGQIISTSTLAQINLSSVVIVDGGFRISCTGLTTNWVSLTPISSFGTITVRFSNN